MKRLTRVLVCAALMASSLIMPVGAWDKYSFVGDSVYFSGQDAVLRAPAMLADTSSLNSASIGGADFLEALSYSGDVYAILNTTLDTIAGDVSGIDFVPGVGEDTLYNGGVNNSGNCHFLMRNGPYSWPKDTSTTTYDNFAGVGFQFVDMDGTVGNLETGYTTATFDLDISSLGDFQTFELSGVMQVRGGLVNPSGAFLAVPYALSVTVAVNGADIRTFYPDSKNFIDFGSSIFNFSKNVESLSFKVSFPLRSYQKVDSFGVQVSFNKVTTATVTTLSGNAALDGNIDDAQDQINDWDSIESEFGSDATEGFNGLDLDNFTYPSDFLAAFSLVSGIFTDLWNCMGEFQIIYLLPLTLGICLLLVGRVSRSSVPSPPPLHTDLPVSNSLGPPSRPALKGGKR